MSQLNKPISAYKKKKIMKCFCLDLTATQTSHLLSINRNTVNNYFNKFREAIYKHQIKEMSRLIGEIEIDECYFGPNRVKERSTKRGRGTHRQPVFGIYERQGRVYTEIIPDCSLRTLRQVISGKVAVDSTIYSDSWSDYNGLVDVGFDKHFRINHKRDEFSNRKGVHINGIEAFWSFTKRRLTKFNGVKKNFHLHLKECEWRWSQTPKELEKSLLKIGKLLV